MSPTLTTSVSKGSVKPQCKFCRVTAIMHKRTWVWGMSLTHQELRSPMCVEASWGSQNGTAAKGQHCVRQKKSDLQQLGASSPSAPGRSQLAAARHALHCAPLYCLPPFHCLVFSLLPVQHLTRNLMDLISHREKVFFIQEDNQAKRSVFHMQTVPTDTPGFPTATCLPGAARRWEKN